MKRMKAKVAGPADVPVEPSTVRRIMITAASILHEAGLTTTVTPEWLAAHLADGSRRPPSHSPHSLQTDDEYIDQR